MSSQVIRLPKSTLASILDCASFPKAHAFGLRDMEAKEAKLPDGSSALRIHLDPLVYCPELRSHHVDDFYALLILDAESPAPHALPRPLSDQLALHILDQVHAALQTLPNLSAHEKLEMASAFNLAQTAVDIQRPTRTRKPDTIYESTVLGEAAALHRIVAPGLAGLDRKLASYRRLVAASGLDAALLRLGFQAELGHKLELSPAGRRLVPAVKARTRRGGINELVRTAHNQLAAFQRAAEAIYAGEVENTSWLQAETLLDIHARLLAGLPGGERGGRLRCHEMRIKSPIDGHIRLLDLPGEEVAEAFADLLAGFDAALWRDFHPILRAALAHVEYCRVHPHSDGNGRMSRILLQALLLESNVPALPLGAILEWNRTSYMDHIAQAVAQRNPLTFVRFLLKAVDQAVAVGRLMIRKLQPHCQSLRDGFLGLGMCPRLAQVAPEFAISMLLGPDEQLIRRTRHGVEISWILNDSPQLDEVDAAGLGLTLSGYHTDSAWCSPIARALLAAPLSLM